MNSNLNRSVLVALSTLSFACSVFQPNQNKGAKVAEIGGKPVYFNEIWDEYQKSNSALQDSLTLSNFTDFTELYTDFKVKLQAAKDGNYYNNADIKSELTSYEEQYAIPYWLEKDIETRLLNELVERSSTELKLSHMLIALQGNESPSDTLKIYNQLIDARNKVLAGADFDSISTKVSTRRDGRSMGGPLGYMSAARAVKPFEDVAYNTPVGGISMPFRTQFGMHILTVLDKQPRTWDRQISHVFWRTGDSPIIQDSVIKLANSLRADILAGNANWDSVVMKYSHDNLSVKNGGAIGWVTQGRYLPAFNDSVFALKNKGDISQGFYSGYGVHLLKLDSVKTYRDEEHLKTELLSTLKNLPRYKNNKEATLKRVRSISKANRNEVNLKTFSDYLMTDSAKKQPFNTLTLPSAISEKIVFTIRDKKFTVNDFMAWLVKNYAQVTADRFNFSMFDGFEDEATSTVLVAVTKDEFPEFKRTTEDYLSGLVVFKITEDSVWNYVKTDTLALQKMFDANPEKYFYDKRYKFVRISTQKDSTLLAIKDSLAKGINIDTVKAQFKGVFMVQDILTDISEDPYYRLGTLKEHETTEVFDYKKRKTALYLSEILEPRQMTFDEAFYRIVADYQPIREKNWIESLRNQYKKTIFKEALEKSFNAKQAN
ncbi:peptidyl-prolyl cis-trans isomerase [bacterium]|nr:MAG: peptidyl-prolyl cis-trans isomerase [bacterium]